ncbi:hypothetical protein METSCH_B03760 [Metschnikowia aff. pulcherrima]|uniref:Uncharacterized protein n=1 Tax=Metschnikowia aff. pulcherrima TaxID=2163413 RepID=A0A4P6XIU7_9ASCO|nr:hypothetical protein METSCH_B03760 [Metschnikowia aff. pulcherrima]
MCLNATTAPNVAWVLKSFDNLLDFTYKQNYVVNVEIFLLVKAISIAGVVLESLGQKFMIINRLSCRRFAAWFRAFLYPERYASRVRYSSRFQKLPSKSFAAKSGSHLIKNLIDIALFSSRYQRLYTFLRAFSWARPPSHSRFPAVKLRPRKYVCTIL